MMLLPDRDALSALVLIEAELESSASFLEDRPSNDATAMLEPLDLVERGAGGGW